MCLGDEKGLRLGQVPSLRIGKLRKYSFNTSQDPRSRCKADYDWVNPRSLRTMSAFDDFDSLAENATCLINSIETTRSMVNFIV